MAPEREARGKCPWGAISERHYQSGTAAVKRYSPIASLAALSERHWHSQISGIFAERTRLVGTASSTFRHVRIPYSPKPPCHPTEYCEIATGAKRPRNDKPESLAP